MQVGHEETLYAVTISFLGIILGGAFITAVATSFSKAPHVRAAGVTLGDAALELSFQCQFLALLYRVGVGTPNVLGFYDRFRWSLFDWRFNLDDNRDACSHDPTIDEEFLNVCMIVFASPGAAFVLRTLLHALAPNERARRSRTDSEAPVPTALSSPSLHLVGSKHLPENQRALRPETAWAEPLGAWRWEVPAAIAALAPLAYIVARALASRCRYFMLGGGLAAATIPVCIAACFLVLIRGTLQPVFGWHTEPDPAPYWVVSSEGHWLEGGSSLALISALGRFSGRIPSFAALDMVFRLGVGAVIGGVQTIKARTGCLLAIVSLHLLLVLTLRPYRRPLWNVGFFISGALRVSSVAVLLAGAVDGSGISDYAAGLGGMVLALCSLAATAIVQAVGILEPLIMTDLPWGWPDFPQDSFSLPAEPPISTPQDKYKAWVSPREVEMTIPAQDTPLHNARSGPPTARFVSSPSLEQPGLTSPLHHPGVEQAVSTVAISPPHFPQVEQPVPTMASALGFSTPGFTDRAALSASLRQSPPIPRATHSPVVTTKEAVRMGYQKIVAELPTADIPLKIAEINQALGHDKCYFHAEVVDPVHSRLAIWVPPSTVAQAAPNPFQSRGRHDISTHTPQFSPDAATFLSPLNPSRGPSRTSPQHVGTSTAITATAINNDNNNNNNNNNNNHSIDPLVSLPPTPPSPLNAGPLIPAIEPIDVPVSTRDDVDSQNAPAGVLQDDERDMRSRAPEHPRVRTPAVPHPALSSASVLVFEVDDPDDSIPPEAPIRSSTTPSRFAIDQNSTFGFTVPASLSGMDENPRMGRDGEGIGAGVSRHQRAVTAPDMH